MALWAYVNGGRPHLEKFFQKPNYEGQREVDFIPKIAANLAKTPDIPTEGITVIELGPGKRSDKTITFMDEFNRVANAKISKKANRFNRFAEYIAIDIVPEYANEATESVRNHFAKESNSEGQIATQSIYRDYNNISSKIPSKGPVMLVSWNSPLWNSPNKYGEVDHNFIIPSAMAKLAKIAGADGHIILTHYPASDPEELEKTYNDEDCISAIKAILNLVEKELKPVCYDREKDPKKQSPVPFSECFDIEIHYDSENNGIKMELISRGDIDVSMGGGDFLKEMVQGENFTAVSSLKPSQASFSGYLQTAKQLKHVNTAPNDNGDVVGQTLKVSN